jgi:predicted dehydrogenase
MNVKKGARIGMIGCGFYAQNHLHAWADLREVGADLVAVCDIDRGRAEAAASQFGARPYTSVDAMLDAEALDFVDIATRLDSHQGIAAKAAVRRIGAIVQKPLAPTLADCVAIVETARRHGSWLAVHENFRFGTAMRRIKAMLDAGDIGQVNWARLSFRTGFDVYENQPYLAQEQRLCILDSGIHILDLGRFFLGEVERISCETQKRNPAIVGEDTATMMLRHKSGAVSLVEATYEAKRLPDVFPETQLEIEGSEGSVILRSGQKLTLTSRGRSQEIDLAPPPLSWTDPRWLVSQEAVLHANAHFLARFLEGRVADTSGEDNLRTFALVEAAYRAAETRGSVSPEYS